MSLLKPSIEKCGTCKHSGLMSDINFTDNLPRYRCFELVADRALGMIKTGNIWQDLLERTPEMSPVRRKDDPCAYLPSRYTPREQQPYLTVDDEPGPQVRSVIKRLGSFFKEIFR